MALVLNAVLPVFIIVALGYGLKRYRFLGPRGWGAVTKLAYYIFFPAFLIPAIWGADFRGLDAAPLALAVAIAATGASVVMFMVRPLFSLSGPSYSSLFQGVLRWNSFVFLPIVANLYGPNGLALAAIVIAALVPVVNVFCVLALARYAQGNASLRQAVRPLVTNPILLACFIGLALNAVQMPHWSVLDLVMDRMGDAALPLGLLLAGSGLNFAALRGRVPTLGLICVLKLGVMPVVMVLLTRALGGDQLAQEIALLVGASPGAAASYVLARQMGGDAPLMAGVVAATTTLSIVTIPLSIWIFQSGTINHWPF